MCILVIIFINNQHLNTKTIRENTNPNASLLYNCLHTTTIIKLCIYICMYVLLIVFISRYIPFIKLERLTRNANGNCFVNKLNTFAVKARVLC